MTDKLQTEACISLTTVLPSGQLVVEFHRVEEDTSVASLMIQSEQALGAVISALVSHDGRKLSSTDCISQAGLQHGFVVTAVVPKPLEARLAFGTPVGETTINCFPDDGGFEAASHNLGLVERHGQDSSFIAKLFQDDPYRSLLAEQPDEAEHLLSILSNATSRRIFDADLEAHPEWGCRFHACSVFIGGHHRLLMKHLEWRPGQASQLWGRLGDWSKKKYDLGPCHSCMPG